MNEYLDTIKIIDKDLIVPTNKDLVIHSIGKDKILLKDIFIPFDCYYNTNEKIDDKICINIFTIKIDDGKWSKSKPIYPELLNKIIKNLFETVWEKYKNDNGKYDKNYVFRHWILHTMAARFWKEGWNLQAWYHKIINIEKNNLSY